jgi:hypothetical protein
MSDNSSFGVKLQFGNGATPEIFTTIGQLADINGPSMSRDAIDVTTHDAPDKYSKFIPGIRDGGEVTYAVNFDPALGTHDEVTGFIGQFNDELVHHYRILYPQSDLEGWSISGFITKLDFKTPIKEQNSGDITIKVSGKPTWGTF